MPWRSVWIVIGFLVVGTLVTLASEALWRGMNQPVSKVRLPASLSEAERAEVRAAISVHLRNGILGTDLAALQRAVQDLSWTRAISISRVWPDAINVGLQRKALAARWGADAYVTTTGDIVMPALQGDGLPTHLPAFECALASPTRAMEVYRLVSAAVRGQDLEVSRLTEDALGEWRVEFGNGVELLLGRDLLRDRVGLFVAVYSSRLRNLTDEVLRVDARYAAGVAVRWRDGAMSSALATIDGVQHGI